jgi:SAM-dependent methyltransferase
MRYLSERGAKAAGLDLSPAMVELARRLNPGLEFRAGDMRALEISDGSLAAIVAFYSVIHLPRSHAGSRRHLGGRRSDNDRYFL